MTSALTLQRCGLRFKDLASGKEPHTGQFAFGKVRCSIAAEPLHTGPSHCPDCQRVTGSAFSAHIQPGALFDVDGVPGHGE